MKNFFFFFFSINQFGTPWPVGSDLVAGSGVAAILGSQCGERMVIDMRIGSSSGRMVRMSGLDRLERRHRCSGLVVVVRHRRVMMETGRIGRRWMAERIAHIHSVVMGRLIEDAARAGSSVLLASRTGRGRMIVEIVMLDSTVDIMSATVAAGSGRERPGVAGGRRVDNGG